MNDFIKRRAGSFVWFVLLALALVLPSLAWRLTQERAMHSTSLLFDLIEIQNLTALQKENKFAKLMEAGISGFFAPEYTGEELAKGVLPNLLIQPLQLCPPEIREKFAASVGTVIVLDDPVAAPMQREYLSRRFDEGESAAAGQTLYYRIPLNYFQLEKTGILPDLRSIQYLSMAGVPIVYAPAPGFSCSVEGVLQSLDYLCSNFAGIKVICPSGEVAAAYPHAQAMGDFVKKRHLLMAQVEFTRQYGSGALVKSAWPNVVSMHAVDREEVLKRGMTRPLMLNRLFRAAKEREIRLIVLRLDPLRGVRTLLEDYCADVRTLRERLDKAGFARRWPSTAPPSPRLGALLSAVALQILLWSLALKYAERYWDVQLLWGRKNQAILLGLSVLLGFLSPVLASVSRISGALAAGLLATEAALMAMDQWKFPLRAVGQAFLLTVGGGLILAGAFSTPLYMWRMSTFSGVKLSLLMPLVLVLLIDLRKREHPESAEEILSRPALWGELVLVGGIFLAALVMLVRSGNYGFVSNGEIAVRDWLESVLGARPRTKEILLGYPALIFWYYLKQNDLWGHWREVLRLASTLAFSSAVNSFCHFHTPLPLTLLRGFNGLWIGVAMGFAVLFSGLCFGRPLYRKVYEHILK